MCSSFGECSAEPIWPSSPAIRPAPKTMKTAIPFAVGVRKTEPSSETAPITSTPPASSMAGITTRSGAQLPFSCVMRTDAAYTRRTYGVHTAAVPRYRATSTVVRPTGRTTSGCSEAALGVAAHDAQRQEDREHNAEEECPEHREPEHCCADQGARIDARRRRADVGEMVEEIPRAEPEEGEERGREHDHDREHAPPERLAQAVACDDEDRAHSVSPTASR